MATSYQHVVYFCEKEGKSYIAVDVLEANGRRYFSTHFELPSVGGEETGFEIMDRVADWLGHTLLIDIPEFRTHIGIEEGKG